MPFAEVTKRATLSGHTDSLYALAATAEHIYTSGADGKIVRWPIAAPEKGELLARLPNTCYTLCFWEGFLIAGQNQDGIHIIDLKGKKEAASLQLGNTTFFSAVVKQDTLYLACGTGEILAIHLPQLRIDKRLQVADTSVRALALNPQKPELAFGTSANTIGYINTETHELQEPWEAHELSVFALGYTTNGRYLFSGSRDAKLKVWQGQQLVKSVVAHMYTINSIAFSPSGEHFATCSKDKSIKLWHSASLKLLKVIDKGRHAGHGTSVNKLAWLNDGQLVSISDDRSGAVWEVAFLK